MNISNLKWVCSLFVLNKKKIMCDMEGVFTLVHKVLQL